MEEVMLSQKGVTVVECAIVLAVLTITGAVFYVPMKTFSHNMQVKAEVSQIICNLKRAKVEAIKRNGSVVVDFTSGSGYLIFEDNGRNGGIAKDWVRQGGERVLGSWQIENGWSITTNYHTPENKIRFNERAGMKAGSIFLQSNKGTKYRVVINTIGRVRSERLN